MHFSVLCLKMIYFCFGDFFAQFLYFYFLKFINDERFYFFLRYREYTLLDKLLMRGI